MVSGMDNSDVLCNEFKVACDICYCNDVKIPVTFAGVVDRLGDIISHDTVSDSLRSLISWGIVVIDISDGKLLLYVSDDAYAIISDLCRRYWIHVIIERGG